MNRRHALRVICFAFTCSFVIGVVMPTGALAAWPAGVTRIAVPTSRAIGPDIYASAAIVAGSYPGG